MKRVHALPSSFNPVGFQPLLLPDALKKYSAEEMMPMQPNVVNCDIDQIMSPKTDTEPKIAQTSSEETVLVEEDREPEKLGVQTFGDGVWDATMSYDSLSQQERMPDLKAERLKHHRNNNNVLHQTPPQTINVCNRDNHHESKKDEHHGTGQKFTFGKAHALAQIESEQKLNNVATIYSNQMDEKHTDDQSNTKIPFHSKDASKIIHKGSSFFPTQTESLPSEVEAAKKRRPKNGIKDGYDLSKARDSQV